MKRPFSKKNRSIEQTLQAWRPTVPSSFASLTSDTTQGTDRLVAAALGQFRLSDQLDESRILGAWAQIVGPALAKNSMPRGIRNGLLVVSVSHPIVLTELRTRLKRDVLLQLQKRFGAKCVRDILFRLEG